MVESVELLRILDSHHVLDILHHTDDRAVAARVATNGAGFAVADVVAHVAIADLLYQAPDGIGKLRHVVRILPQQVQHQSQGRLAPYAWQLGELLYRPF